MRVEGAGAHVLAPASLVSLVSGPQEGAIIGTHDGRLSGIEVSMTPFAAFSLFGVPVAELTNRIADLTELWGAEACGLAAALGRLPGWAERFARLDDLLITHFARGPQ